MASDDNSAGLEPIDLEPRRDSVVEEGLDVRTLAYKMVRPYIVAEGLDYHTEVCVGSCADCNHIGAWLVDYTHKIHTDFDFDFDNSHKGLPSPLGPSRNHRCILCDGQPVLGLVQVRSELRVQATKRLQV